MVFLIHTELRCTVNHTSDLRLCIKPTNTQENMLYLTLIFTYMYLLFYYMCKYSLMHRYWIYKADNFVFAITSIPTVGFLQVSISQLTIFSMVRLRMREICHTFLYNFLISCLDAEYFGFILIRGRVLSFSPILPKRLWCPQIPHDNECITQGLAWGKKNRKLNSSLNFQPVIEWQSLRLTFGGAGFENCLIHILAQMRCFGVCLSI